MFMFTIASRFSKKKNIFLCLIISQLLIFLNYYAWLISSYIDLSNLRIIFALLIFAICFYSIAEVSRQEKLLGLIFIFYIIICLGSPSFHWDARSFWLFVSKQLFFDQSFDYIFKNYHIIHDANFYPVLGPTLGSSIAELFGNWNEIYPKLFSIFLSIPPLIYLSFFLKNKFSTIVYIGIILFILEKSFVIGEMDGVVAIYFTNCTILSIQLFQNQNVFKIVLFKINLSRKLFIFFIFLNFSFLTLLKIEASVYLFIIIFSFYLCGILKNKSFSNKNFSLFFLSFLSIFIWIYFIYTNTINLSSHSGVSVFFEKEFVKIFFNQLLEFKNIFFISKYIYLNKPFFISLCITIFFLTLAYSSSKKMNNNEIDVLIILSSIVILYIFFIYFVFLVSQADLSWQLSVSAQRVMLPLSFLISFFSLLIIQSKINSNKFFY